MKLIKVFLFSALALTGSMLQAQESYMLTLDQARDYALQHNKTLLNARDQVTSAKQKFNEARAQGLPQVNGTVDFMTYFNYEMNFSFGSSEGGTIPDFNQPPFDAGDAALARIYWKHVRLVRTHHHEQPNERQPHRFHNLFSAGNTGQDFKLPELPKNWLIRA